MADADDPSDPVRSDAERSSRSNVVHHGASEMGLLAPTPIAFGIVTAAVVADAAAATTTARTAGRDANDAAQTHVRASVAADAEAARPTGESVLSATGMAGPARTAPEPQVELAVNGHAVGFVPFEHVARPAAQSLAAAATHEGAEAPLPQSATPPPIDAVDAVRTSAEALTGALEAQVSQLDVPAQQAVADVASTIDGLTNALDAQAGTLAASAGNTVAALEETVVATLDAVGSQADALLDRSSALAGDFVAGVSGAVDHVSDITVAVAGHATAATGQVLAATDEVVASAANATDTILAEVANTATGLIEDVQAGLAGADPVGGLATLTGLLNASDGFEIVREGEATPVFASVAVVPDVAEPIVGTLTAGLDPDDGGLLDSASDLLSPILGSEKHGLGSLFDGDHDHG